MTERPKKKRGFLGWVGVILLSIIVIVCFLGALGGAGFDLIGAHPIEEPLNNIGTATIQPTTVVPVTTILKTPVPTPAPTKAVSTPAPPKITPRVTEGTEEPEVTPTKEECHTAGYEDLVFIEEIAEPIGNGQYQHYIVLENSNWLFHFAGKVYFCSHCGSLTEYTMIEEPVIIHDIPPERRAKVAVPGAIDNDSGPIGARLQSMVSIDYCKNK